MLCGTTSTSGTVIVSVSHNEHSTSTHDMVLCSREGERERVRVEKRDYSWMGSMKVVKSRKKYEYALKFTDSRGIIEDIANKRARNSHKYWIIHQVQCIA